ncbi:MAG: AAA family ATPase [Candidatus Woesearchaeota archaeon]
MLIRHLQLENIRSFTNEEISIPRGTILLSGDIGAGKSTLLIAIEFALFGILRGTVNGTSILRHGKKEGSVTLTFSIASKEITIKRTLKRQKDSVQQGNGYIVIDNIRTEGTSTELKARILELLGYPQELLSRSKNLIYRYTVFTPQEEMKQILLEESDARVDTLRKAFGLDKYNRIRENITIYTRKLKEQNKVLEGKASGLEAKEEQYKNILQEMEEKKRQLDPESLEKQRKLVQEKKQKFQEIEEKIKKIQEQKHSRKILDEKILHEVSQRKQLAKDIEQLQEQLRKLDEELKEIPDKEKLQERIDSLREKAGTVEKEISAAHQRMGGLTSKRKEAEEIKKKIFDLTHCPTCEQTVSTDHKQKIKEREDSKISTVEKENKKLEDEISKKKKEKQDIDKELEKLQKELQQVQLLLYKKKNYTEKSEEKKKKEEQFQKTKQTIADLNKQKMEIKVPEEGIDEQRQQIKKAVDEEQDKLKRQEILQESIKGRLQENQKTKENLEKEIAEKKEAKKQHKATQKTIQWCEEYFVQLMKNIERNVMRTIQREFNEYFKGWFSMLIDDELLSARLDEEFTPIIEQNGYETSVASLSGGEKTSCALAYRLALNKVINDVVESIKTKDLIILDEPTDGFSSEQLDRVRDVLDSLHMEQIILVSHESKVESFVDTNIRVEKKNHESKIEK